jgi:DNA mismatch endonuclease (patch repair protein)
MTDVFSKAERSSLMGRIGPRNTRPELVVKKFLRLKGCRYRSHVKRLPGTPDIVLPELRHIILVNGCFWHQHRHCSRSALPKSNEVFWIAKLRRNIQRDKNTKKLLRNLGWSVTTVWECQLKNAEAQRACFERLARRFEKAQ